MGNREQFKRLVIFLEGFALMGVQTFLFGYIWYTQYIYTKPMELNPFWVKGNWAVIGMYALILFLFTMLFGGFKIGSFKGVDIFISQILSLLCANIVAYVQICIITREYLSAAPLLVVSAIEFAVIILWITASRYVYKKLYPAKKMLLIYGENSPKFLIDKMNTRADKYNISGIINISEGTEAVIDKIMDYEAVVICDVPAETRNFYLKYCYRYSIKVYMMPKISDIIITGSEKINLFDTPLLLSRNYGLSIEHKFFKRIMDIVISLLLLVVTAPFTILTACMIKLYDKGPVIYTQERLTIDGKKFLIYKFRSMRNDSEEDGARLAAKDDDRITPIGRILRKTHLDELPQIFNILKGDMAFVGPRPERPEIHEQYEEQVPEFGFRLKVKAGLTGYAQVYGKYNTTPYDKLKLDLYYIQNFSIWLDLKLVLMTFRILFQKDSTEGIEKEQVTAIKEEMPVREEMPVSREVAITCECKE